MTRFRHGVDYFVCEWHVKIRDEAIKWWAVQIWVVVLLCQWEEIKFWLDWEALSLSRQVCQRKFWEVTVKYIIWFPASIRLSIRVPDRRRILMRLYFPVDLTGNVNVILGWTGNRDLPILSPTQPLRHQDTLKRCITGCHQHRGLEVTWSSSWRWQSLVSLYKEWKEVGQVQNLKVHPEKERLVMWNFGWIPLESER